MTYLWEVLVVSPALFPDQQQVKTEAQKEKEEGCSNLIVLTGSWLGPAHGLWPPGGRQYCWQLWRWEECHLDQKLHSVFVSCQTNGV